MHLQIKSNKMLENKFNKSSRILALGLGQKVQNIFERNYEDPNKCEGILCSWIRRHNSVKMAILPKLIYRFNTISMKISVAFLQELIRLC